MRRNGLKNKDEKVEQGQGLGVGKNLGLREGLKENRCGQTQRWGWLGIGQQILMGPAEDPILSATENN